MINKQRTHKTYTREFKLEAVRLMEHSDRPASDFAAALGIRRHELYRWKAQLADAGESTFTGKRGRPKKESQSELSQLKQEKEPLREGVKILKKASTDFAKQLN